MKTLKLVGRIIVPVQKSREDGVCFFVFIKQAVNSLNSRMGVDGLYRVGDECCSVFKCIPHNNGKYYY